MYPMTFSEFLIADNCENLVEYMKYIKEIENIPDIFFNKLEEKLKAYFIIGGMPEVVDIWVKEKNMELSKFFFMGFASKSRRLDLIEAYIVELQEKLACLEQIKSATESQPDFDEDYLSMLKEKGSEIQTVSDVQEIAYFQCAMLDLSIDKIKFEIDWFENFRKKMNGKS